MDVGFHGVARDWYGEQDMGTGIPEAQMKGK
jgi:hypothetical protein